MDCLENCESNISVRLVEYTPDPQKKTHEIVIL